MIHYDLKKYNIRSRQGYGKYFAHTRRRETMDLTAIEEMVEHSCSVTRADVRAVLSALYDGVKTLLQDGHVVDLGEFGRFYISVTSVGVERTEDWNQQRHITGFQLNYTPERHHDHLRGGHYLTRPMLKGCRARRDKEKENLK
ncbi:MAG: hypothetical protein WCS15_06805 [Prevotella sp.]|nr:hypothetical protein [Massilibacteroides sp.]MDD2601460.1 hypothetical protein [Prevotella sp.]MDD3387951.1 hypothetical protein [Prevotella sp.]MDD4534823.1 hypothetical protein [Prevotella sp.]